MIYGRTEPRLFTPPLRELTEETTLGFLAIVYAETILRKKLYEWQKWSLIHALEIIGDLQTEWKFRFRTLLFLISRQNGKTVLSEVIASFFLKCSRYSEQAYRLIKRKKFGKPSSPIRNPFWNYLRKSTAYHEPMATSA